MKFDALTFLDVEADRSGRVIAVGVVRGQTQLRVAGDADGMQALERLCRDNVVAGHNIRAHDLPLLASLATPLCIPKERVIDTLLLSFLADPLRPSHALSKPAKQPGELPDPVRDALEARALGGAAVDTLTALPPTVLQFLASLLAASGEVALCRALGFEHGSLPAPLAAYGQLPADLLDRLCRVQLQQLLAAADGGAPELYQALALSVRFVQLHAAGGRLSAPPSAALAHVPRFTSTLSRLLGPLCPDLQCTHRFCCQIHKPLAVELLQSHFELAAFRPHQEEVVSAVLSARAPLVILPTGGGKSLCYQLPAIHGAERLRGLTVVISPLQALMADQVRSLSQRFPASCLINASLLMEQRKQILEGLYSGRYHIVYMGPEQLRNPSVVRLLRTRPPFLWVIDEAHCISQWGHSFRTDYTYLPRAIASIHGSERTPLLALFTATAAAEVRADISTQFREGLAISLTLMHHGSRRENLTYEVRAVPDAQAKSNQLLNLLDAFSKGARLVYCATVRNARAVHELLRERGVDAALYHGQLAPNEKSEQLERFLSGRANTVVATSAFGMGIDKPDIRLVVHYEPSSSLEDFVQETGRAGRDGAPADCVFLYDEADLETQFFLKTMSRITAREVTRIFRALRTRARRFAHKRDQQGFVDLWVSAEDLFVEEQLERDLDWSREVLPSKLKLVLYHLEADGVCARQENRTRPWGLVPLCSYAEALLSLPRPLSPVTQRVLEYLFDPARPRKLSVLDIAEECAVRPVEAFREVQHLSQLELIGQELSFEVTLARGVPRATDELLRHAFSCAAALLDLAQDDAELCIVQLRSAAGGVARMLRRAVRPHEVFQVLRALRAQGMLRLDRYGPGRYRVEFEPSLPAARERLRNARRVAEAVWSYLDARSSGRRGRDIATELDVQRFLQEERRLTESFRADEVVEACLFLHHVEAWHLADPPVLLESSMHVRVKVDAPKEALDLKRPRRYHEHQIALVHMLREYAVLAPGKRERFLADYFELPRKQLIERYFRGRKQKLSRPVSPTMEARLLSNLTEAQRDAVTAEDPALLVMAGPGSGKTHTVVRRVCHMIRARQIRASELLVLTFNRAAASELRRRLYAELGERSRGVDVRTFHSLALQLTGADLHAERSDADERLARAVVEAAQLLEGGDDYEDHDARAEAREHVVGQIRHVLVDEYQDLDPDQYRLLRALLGKTSEPRGADERIERSVYVVGDDDQAIYGFRKASVEFLRQFEQEFDARRVFLADNFRSHPQIVELAQRFIAQSEGRMKSADQIMCARAAAVSGEVEPARCFLYADLEQLSAHAAYIVQRSLEQGQASFAVLARNWYELDPLRAQLEAAGVPFVLQHSDHHRPIHRRYPAERLLRQLSKEHNTLEGSAAELLRLRARAMGRDPGEPSLDALIGFAQELDAERTDMDGKLAVISLRELSDSLFLASRDAALRTAPVAPGTIQLSTFHGAKGLEFDKVIVLPSRPAAGASCSEERRLYYVALTRARHQLIACTLGRPGELAAELALPPRDLRNTTERLRVPAAAFLDCTPADVQLAGPQLGAAQRAISSLCEGDSLELARDAERVELRHADSCIGILSKQGAARLDRASRRQACQVSARVHEIYVHLTRDGQGTVRRRDLVVVPSFRIEQARVR